MQKVTKITGQESTDTRMRRPVESSRDTTAIETARKKYIQAMQQHMQRVVDPACPLPDNGRFTHDCGDGWKFVFERLTGPDQQKFTSQTTMWHEGQPIFAIVQQGWTKPVGVHILTGIMLTSLGNGPEWHNGRAAGEAIVGRARYTNREEKEVSGWRRFLAFLCRGSDNLVCSEEIVVDSSVGPDPLHRCRHMLIEYI